MPKLKAAPSPKTLNPIAGAHVSPEINGVRSFTTSVPIDDLFGFRRNKNQRDEEVRNLNHLSILQPEHLLVHVLQCHDGKIILIDGHSRRYTWSLNELIRPDIVELRVYDITDPSVDFEEQELRLYNNHDSRRAVKTSAHTVQGAMNALELELSTPWLRQGNFSEALKKSAHLVPGAPSFKDHGVTGLINFFRDALVELDNILPVRQKFNAPYIAAAVILLHSKSKIAATRAMLQDYSGDARGFSSGALYSSYSHLAMYRDDGLDGTGLRGASKGKFGTSYDDMNKAVPQILSFMVKCRDHANETYAVDAIDINPLSRREILAL